VFFGQMAKGLGRQMQGQGDQEKPQKRPTEKVRNPQRPALPTPEEVTEATRSLSRSFLEDGEPELGITGKSLE
jgi:hypothetical protein